MNRQAQTVIEILSSVSSLPASWKDPGASSILKAIQSIPTKDTYTDEDVLNILDGDFRSGMFVIQYLLELSKDEFYAALRGKIGGPIGVTRYRQDREAFRRVVHELDVPGILSHTVHRPITWRDIIPCYSP